MIDKALKEKIAKLYSATTKISIVLAVASIIVSVAAQYAIHSAGSIDFYLSYAAALLLIATPFTGVIIALAYYMTQKNRKMITFSAVILIILVTGIFFKI